ETTASSAGKMESIAKYVSDAARSVQFFRENSLMERLAAYFHDLECISGGESGLDSASGAGARLAFAAVAPALPFPSWLSDSEVMCKSPQQLLVPAGSAGAQAHQLMHRPRHPLGQLGRAATRRPGNVPTHGGWTAAVERCRQPRLPGPVQCPGHHLPGRLPGAGHRRALPG